nr:hypothetical protein [Chroococcidiopsis sp. CCALA 051]
MIIATGAGAGSRQSLDTAVFGGMFSCDFLKSIFCTSAVHYCE